MEKVAIDLDVAKLKKEDIRKACEQVNAEASSMVMLCLQWGDLERHFDGVQKELEVGLEKNSQRERSLDERAMRLDQEERRLCVLREEIRRKQHELGIVEERDDGCCEEMAREGMESAKECSVVPAEEGEDNVDDSSKEVKSKRDMFAKLESCNGQCCKQLDLKRQELETVQISLSGKSRELESREEDLVRVGFRLEFQQEELIRVEKYAQERRDEVQRVEKELGSLRNEIRGKERELNRVKKSIDGCVRELEVKECLLESIKQQIKEYSQELASFKPSGKELSKDLVLKNGELGAVHLDIENHIVETEENNEQPAKRKLIGEDNVMNPSKRARNDSIVPMEQGCGSPDVNPGSVYTEIRIFSCPGPEFSDFDKLRSHFTANQFWACYDDDDVMPRYYARVDKVLSPDFKLLISWLVALPESQAEHDWSEKELPIACGYFAFGETEETEDPRIFSHLIQCENFPHSNLAYCGVYPREGETWAIFKKWDIGWSSDPERHRPYRYDYVEILSDFDEDSGVTVAYLCKVKGFVALFQRVDAGNAVADAFCHILPDDKYRFSHRIPSFKMTGKERANVPDGSFELDPAGLDLDDLRDDRKKENTSMTLYSAGHGSKVKTMAENKKVNSEEAFGVRKREVVIGLTSRILGGKSAHNWQGLAQPQSRANEAEVLGEERLESTEVGSPNFVKV